MADYIYLLENRLSADQQAALSVVREVARKHGLTVFLVGGAVRDLTSGSPVRDLDVAVQGNALKLKKDIEVAGGTISGEHAPSQRLFMRFPGSVRVEVGSTLSVTYPKPGKPVYKPAPILDDLRRRDFTVNSMALSLNDGSYALLMDPLNGVADIENRQIRLVSNYGFIEDPIRMVRAMRFAARLGWTMDEKTQGRYDTGKDEGYIEALSDFERGYETEEIFHEEDPLMTLRRLEEEGWMKHLFPAMTVARVNTTEMEKLRDAQTQLLLRGIHPDTAAAYFPLLTAKIPAKDVAELKKSFVRPGFVKEIEALEGEAKEFASLLTSREASTPSQTWKLIVSARPEAVLWTAFSSKSTAVQNKLKSFYNDWPQARNKIPYALMQEMRITPELPGFDELVEKLFFELMDGHLGTTEEMKAFLEPYSPPAPPPPVNLRRARASKKDAKGKGRKKAVAVLDEEEAVEEMDKLLTEAEDTEEEAAEEEEQAEEEHLVEKVAPAPAKPKKAAAKPAPAAKSAPPPAPAKVAAPAKKTTPAKPAPVPAAKKVAAPVPAKKAVAKPAPKAAKGAAPKPAAKKIAAPAKKAMPAKAVKKAVPAAKKASVKTPAKKAVPAKKPVAVKKPIPAAKKAAPAKKAVPTKKNAKPAPKKKR